MGPPARRLAGAAAGIALDRVFGEPPSWVPHPVALLGRVLATLERHTYADDRRAGVVHAALGITVGAASGAALRSTTAATAICVAGRMLGDTALVVAAHLDAGDIDGARAALPSLVGRDPSTLGASAIARAVVESVAENTVDAVVAPALWGAALGAPGAAAHKAVSTLDSMVGHRSPRYLRFGWASARLDDAVAWVPARTTALLVAAVRPRCARAVITAVRRDAPAHPSPNAGVAEAAFAAALGLRLGGEARYGARVEHRPPLGDGRPPAVADIAAAVRLSADVSWALAATLGAIAAMLVHDR
ncbi:MAG: adenosylcobinamide-phosphate synthase CbiB [Acidimicrobiales bacterium]